MFRIARAVRAIKQQQVPDRRPLTPYVTLRTSNSLNVEWSATEGVVSIQNKSHLTYLQICEPDSLEWKTVYRGFLFKYCISDLCPGTLYKLRLRVDHEGKQGVWGDVVTAQTRDEIISMESLHRAIQYGYSQEVVKILQARPTAASSVYSDMGLSALQLAVLQGDRKMVELVLSVGACDVDAESIGGASRTALMLACGAGHDDIITLLVQRGASWHTSDRNGLTALHYATDASRVKAVILAIDGGANLEAEDCSGWTPLMRGILLYSSVQVIEELLKHGANANHKDNDGLNCLAAAVLCERNVIIEMLIKKGADINIPGDAQKNTPIMIAAGMENEEIMRILAPPVSPVSYSPAVHINVDSEEEHDKETIY